MPDRRHALPREASAVTGTVAAAGARPAGVPLRYTGRFAPSPTGPLHAGSLVAALASWLDARAHGGRWLVRIEDVDTPRCVAGADAALLAQLAACGLMPDEPPVWQSARVLRYQAALDVLSARRWAYPCACSRSDIEAALAERGAPRSRHGELAYPGTCRDGLHGKPARAVRVLAAASAVPPDTPPNMPPQAPPQMPPHAPLHIAWADRRLGEQAQNVTDEVGDFVLKRADGLWAYQLAVVVDDAEQGVTHVVRGEDLTDNTARQIHLQRLLGLATPAYLHTPLVLGGNGEKLSKQNCALPLDVSQPARALNDAAAVLKLRMDEATTLSDALSGLIAQWKAHWLA